MTFPSIAGIKPGPRYYKEIIVPFEQDYLCATCKQTDRSCPLRDHSTTECQFYAPDLPNVYTSSRKPQMTEYAAVDGFLREFERAKTEHDWSGYYLLKAARKVLAEACEVVHAVEHWDEGRDTIEHVVEELDHVGGTAIRMRLMVEEMRGKE